MTDTKSPDIERVCREARAAIGTMADGQKGLIRGMEAVGQDLAVMREILSKTDEDGMSLTYAPRRWGDKLGTVLLRIDALIEPLSKVVIGQGDLINIIHKIDNRLEQVMLGEQTWRGEVRQSLRTLDDVQQSLKDGVSVKDCSSCAAKGEVAITSDGVKLMLPMMTEAHQFVLKWKYGFVPFLLVVISSLITVILKLVEVFSKVGTTPLPPTP